MFDPTEAGFLADPYPTLSALREETPVFYEETLGRWFVTRHADVRACLRDRRLGRNFRHVGSEEEFGAEPLDPRWQAFWDSRALEPALARAARAHADPEARRGGVHAPQRREPALAGARTLAHELLEPLARARRDGAAPRLRAAVLDRRDLPPARRAAPTGTATCSTGRTRIVKMYEFDTTEEQAAAATQAAAEFRDYVLELIEERRREPRDDMVTRARRGARRRRGG